VAVLAAARRTVDVQRRLGDGDGDIAAGRVVVVVAVEGPVGGASGDVGEGLAQVQQAAEVRRRRFHPGGPAGGAVGLPVVGSRVAVDRDARVGLGDGVADRAAGVVVVAGDVGERPAVGGAAGVGVGGARQVQAAEALAQHARGHAGGGVG